MNPQTQDLINLIDSSLLLSVPKKALLKKLCPFWQETEQVQMIALLKSEPVFAKEALAENLESLSDNAVFGELDEELRKGTRMLQKTEESQDAEAESTRADLLLTNL